MNKKSRSIARKIRRISRKKNRQDNEHLRGIWLFREWSKCLPGIISYRIKVKVGPKVQDDLFMMIRFIQALSNYSSQNVSFVWPMFPLNYVHTFIIVDFFCCHYRLFLQDFLIFLAICCAVIWFHRILITVLCSFDIDGYIENPFPGGVPMGQESVFDGN